MPSQHYAAEKYQIGWIPQWRSAPTPPPASSSRGTEFPLQHGGESMHPAFFLAGHGLSGIEPLFQAKPRLRITQAQDARTVLQLEQKHLDVTFHGATLASKTESDQHLIKSLRRGGT